MQRCRLERPASWPSSCSGAMYWNVPRMAPCCVNGASCVGSAVNPPPACSAGFNFANPKSRSFAPAVVSMMLPGLRSRWTIPCRCGLVQRIRYLDGDLQRLIQRQRAFLQPLCQRLPLQVLHDQEVDPVLTPDVMERADMRMVQAGNGLRLALEPLFEIGVGGDMLGEIR